MLLTVPRFTKDSYFSLGGMTDSLFTLIAIQELGLNLVESFCLTVMHQESISFILPFCDYLPFSFLES
ncbi:hypothetical protein FGO68_gene6248 [Halteria grandinella]|uniref:Uncharacterized protein n=1 Tax=Halteria grandinella TaxID=5974 RepID=A0A8J8SVZ0_HALGN|nr:hypothetical protein FGO68_gene6248 [Halteria grandinella]